MSQIDALSRRQFNALLLSAGAAYALVKTMRGKDARCEVSQTIPSSSAFLHPGMLHSQGDLARMREGVQRQTQPICAGFEVLRTHPLSQSTYSSAGAFTEIGRNPNVHSQEFDRDANAAYQCALMSCITGDPAYAKVSYSILNAWAASLREITGADAVLCATLGGFKMVNAAELMRHTTSDWNGKYAELFAKMLREVFLPVIDNFAPFANGNWDTAAMKMMLAIAIYGDDRPLFERALQYYRFGCGDGRLEHYIYPTGECQESGRDQQHTQLGLAHMGDCSEMAWHQGLDLYASFEDRLLVGFEYTARYNLGEDVQFHPDIDQTGKYSHAAISPRSSLRPVYEQIYNHYVHRRGQAAPWTQKAAEKLRPEGAAPGADHTGFGTLLYTREAGPDTVETASVAVPSGLHARRVDGAIELDFVPLARQAKYSIARAEGAHAPYTVIARNVAGSAYRDLVPESSHLYSYRVSAVSSGRTSLPVEEMSGLPSGWQRHTVGQIAGKCDASFDGVAYRLCAGGTPPGSQYISAFLVHRAMPAGSEFTARIVPLIASQFLQLGIAILSDEIPPTVDAMLSLSPHGELERPAWTAHLVGPNQAGAPMRTIGTRPLTEPAVTYGRLVAPLWLRFKRDNAMLRAAISLDGSAWSEIGVMNIPSGGRRVGLFLNSGLEKVTTEVCFDRVSLQSSSRTI